MVVLSKNTNVQKVVDITTNHTYSEDHQDYLDDGRNQNYSIIDGLGPYNTDAFIKEAGAATTLIF